MALLHLAEQRCVVFLKLYIAEVHLFDIFETYTDDKELDIAKVVGKGECLGVQILYTKIALKDLDDGDTMPKAVNGILGVEAEKNKEILQVKDCSVHFQKRLRK